jgi:uncharacterized membrane protein HdeD (DUF308 family)
MEEKNEENEIQSQSQEIEVQPEEVVLEEMEAPKVAIYPMPLTKVGFFFRGLIAIAIGAFMFLNQANALQILGTLLGCAIIVLSVLNIIIGYRERFKEFYAKWLIAGGMIGIIFGVITVFVPSLVSQQVFLLLTLLTLALIILGFCDIALAIYLRKIPGTRGALLLLGLLAIVAGVLIYVYPDNLVEFFCMYATTSGVLSIAISLFMKKDR